MLCFLNEKQADRSSWELGVGSAELNEIKRQETEEQPTTNYKLIQKKAFGSVELIKKQREIIRAVGNEQHIEIKEQYEDGKRICLIRQII